MARLIQARGFKAVGIFLINLDEDLRASPRRKATFEALMLCLQVHAAAAPSDFDSRLRPIISPQWGPRPRRGRD